MELVASVCLSVRQPTLTTITIKNLLVLIEWYNSPEIQSIFSQGTGL